MPLALGVEAIDADVSIMPKLKSGDLIVAVPDQWAWLAATQGNWPEHIQGASSTAPLPAHVHDALTQPTASSSQQAKLSRLLQIYGSTETAGLAYRTQSSGQYTLAGSRVRNAQDGIDLRLASGALHPMAVQDELQWVSDNSFNLLRRADQSVQVAGHNVSPAWVVDQLQAHTRVKQASVRLDGHANAPRLKAFIVLNTDGTDPEALRASLEQWILDALPAYAAFSSITYGSELPRNVMGKLCDWPVLH